MLDSKLDTFLVLCETRNYTRAASVLNITQPAVTQHIKYLENHYSTKLFYYDEKRGLLYIQNLELPVVTKYFDLSKIIPAIEYCATLQEKQKNNTGN